METPCNPCVDRERRGARSTAARTRQGPPGDNALAFERALFFSDAVFAIAITLLIIEIRLPDLPEPVTDAAVLDALAGLVPSILAYALGLRPIGLSAGALAALSVRRRGR